MGSTVRPARLALFERMLLSVPTRIRQRCLSGDVQYKVGYSHFITGACVHCKGCLGFSRCLQNLFLREVGYTGGRIPLWGWGGGIPVKDTQCKMGADYCLISVGEAGRQRLRTTTLPLHFKNAVHVLPSVPFSL